MRNPVLPKKNDFYLFPLISNYIGKNSDGPPEFLKLK